MAHDGIGDGDAGQLIRLNGTPAAAGCGTPAGGSDPGGREWRRRQAGWEHAGRQQRSRRKVGVWRWGRLDEGCPSRLLGRHVAVGVGDAAGQIRYAPGQRLECDGDSGR
jgi:hypothetical protein